MKALQKKEIKARDKKIVCASVESETNKSAGVQHIDQQYVSKQKFLPRELSLVHF